MPCPPECPREPSLPAFHLLVKPAGAACNLSCAYCYYLGKRALYPDDHRMSHRVLEQYVRQLIKSHRGDHVEVSWQGGEPTLMGLDFYRHAMDLVEKYRRPGMTVSHIMQTNGTLLDDDWAAFFKQHDFLVGISLDGPRELHDAYRIDHAGRPTFDAVIRGLRLLQKHGVEHNVLTTVNRTNADRPLEVYRFLRDDAKATWMQFIPVVERVGEDGLTPDPTGCRVSRRSVLPDRFGRFLIDICDEWVRRDVGRVFVQTFEATLRNWLGLSSSGMCVFNEICGRGPALERNGDLYSCDHFVDPRHKLGNIMEEDMAVLMRTPQQVSFGLEKAKLPSRCQECDVLFACRGECPKNRITPSGGEGPGVNYLCDGYRAFFHHTSFTMRVMAGLIRRGRAAEEVMQMLNKPLADVRRLDR